MFYFTLLVAAAIIQVLQAQENGPEYINIAAGESPLTFVHPQTPAGINDVIIWSFVTGGNHSVIQSTYEKPCHYLPGGFYSGFQAVPPRPGGGAGGGPIVFLVTINTTDPIYYYCGQIGHCQAGMIGVINPPCNEGNSFTASGSYIAYKSLAMAVTEVGPLPSVIRGGQLVSTYPTGRPTGSPGPYYTGYSASCTAGVNSSSNLTESLTTSATISAATSAATSAAKSATSSGLQPLASSGSGSLYGGILLKGQELPSVFWQARSGFGVVIVVLFAFVIL